MNEHRPFPWTAERSSLNDRVLGVTDAEGRDVRLCGFGISGSEEATANTDALLRKANEHADLLEALRALRAYAIPGMDWSDEAGRQLLKMADEALAKASVEAAR